MCGFQSGSIGQCDGNGMKIWLFVGDVGMFNDEVASHVTVSQCVMEVGWVGDYLAHCAGGVVCFMWWHGRLAILDVIVFHSQRR